MRVAGAIDVGERAFVLDDPSAACPPRAPRGSLVGRDGAGEVFAAEEESGGHPRAFVLVWEAGTCVAQSTRMVRLSFRGERDAPSRCPIAFEVTGCAAGGADRGRVLAVDHGAAVDARWTRLADAQVIARQEAEGAFERIGVPSPWPAGASLGPITHLDLGEGYRYVITSSALPGARFGAELGLLVRGEQRIWASGRGQHPEARIDIGPEPWLLFLYEPGAWELRSMVDGRSWTGEYP